MYTVQIMQIVQKKSYTYHFWSQVLYIVSLRAKGLAKKAGREEAGSGGGTKRDKNTDGSLEWTTNQYVVFNLLLKR